MQTGDNGSGWTLGGSGRQAGPSEAVTQAVESSTLNVSGQPSGHGSIDDPNGDKCSEKDSLETESQPLNPLQLDMRTTPDRGRGLFATSTIPAGTLLEESPVLLLTKEQWDSGKMNDTILGEYGFCWSQGGMALGLGMGESSPCSFRPARG